MGKKKTFSQTEVQYIINLYVENKMSFRKIRLHTGVTETVIRRVLVENNIPIRNLSESHMRYSCNYSYFKTIDSVEKAYWLGFIYADGFVTKSKNFGIKLSIRDRDHLERFNKSLGSSYPIKTYVNKTGYGAGNEYCMITIIHQEMYNDLVQCGVIPNKSNILQFPTFLNDDLIRFFILGYFDGDGSVYKITQGNTGGASFSGTKDMLKNINKHVCPRSKASVLKDLRKNKQSYELKIGGRNNMRDLYNYLYIDAPIYITRKKLLFEEILGI